MSLASEPILAELLAPFLQAPIQLGMQALPPAELTPALGAKLLAYLDLLLRWNARTNLTAVRTPEAIIERHFGESLFAARILHALLPPQAEILDYGSGAGFPGLPIQLLAPDFQVTLAESQGKKAAFLREAVRTLSLSTPVWAQRVEQMPAESRFTAVTLRAVDDSALARQHALTRLAPGGWLIELASSEPRHQRGIPMPGKTGGQVLLSQPPEDVPRGT